jgi:hypothetical protein
MVKVHSGIITSRTKKQLSVVVEPPTSGDGIYTFVATPSPNTGKEMAVRIMDPQVGRTRRRVKFKDYRYSTPDPDVASLIRGMIASGQLKDVKEVTPLTLKFGEHTFDSTPDGLAEMSKVFMAILEEQVADNTVPDDTDDDTEVRVPEVEVEEYHRVPAPFNETGVGEQVRQETEIKRGQEAQPDQEVEFAQDGDNEGNGKRVGQQVDDKQPDRASRVEGQVNADKSVTTRKGRNTDKSS